MKFFCELPATYPHQLRAALAIVALTAASNQHIADNANAAKALASLGEVLRTELDASFTNVRVEYSAHMGQLEIYYDALTDDCIATVAIAHED